MRAFRSGVAEKKLEVLRQAQDDDLLKSRFRDPTPSPAAAIALATRSSKLQSPMNLAEFQLSQNQSTPPAGLSLALQSLWFDVKGDWDKAHDLAQKDGGPSGDWVHAYLHRKEGDTSNARYWYVQAGQPVYSGPLEEEWAAISEALLEKK